MNSYSRLLIHRLADIFGFSHHSVGEGDDRHLVLERCPETSIPSILVSDLLWQYDDSESPKILEVAKRKENSSGSSTVNPKFEISLEEREAAYLAARERIFSVNEFETGEPVKHRPQNNPVVARRMIAHALGQRIRPSSSQEVSQSDPKELQDPENSSTKIQEEEEKVSSIGIPEGNDMTGKHLKSSNKEKGSMPSGSSSLHSQTKTSLESVDKTVTESVPSCKERVDKNIQKANFRQEHMGAAKRMFANALGFQPRNANLPKSSQSK